MRLFHCAPLLAAIPGIAVAGRLSFPVALDAAPERRVSARCVRHRSANFSPVSGRVMPTGFRNLWYDQLARQLADVIEAEPAAWPNLRNSS